MQTIQVNYKLPGQDTSKVTAASDIDVRVELMLVPYGAGNLDRHSTHLFLCLVNLTN